MKRFVVPLAVACALTVIGQVAVPQDVSGTNPEEIKYLVVPMPRGRVSAQASKIDREWSPRIVHLKGNARVRIYTATQDPHGAIVMQADEVDLNQSTGEISPRGNIRITVEDVK
jgi:lipopolysaccharide assembly outer membrane protein LptD (OstA)